MVGAPCLALTRLCCCLSFLTKMPPAKGALRLDSRVANGLFGAFPPPVDFLKL